MIQQKLKDKWALVTGSSRGIGRQIAKGLAILGCKVYVHGRKKANTEETCKLLDKYNVEVVPVEAELSSSKEIEAMIKIIMNHSGGVDILYNNAAIMNKWNEIWKISLKEWEDSFQVNLYAMIILCNAFAPGMRDRGYGRIINVSSGIKETPHLAPYSVTKAAVDKYTKDLAAELKDTDVLVNYLDPGWIKTDLGGENAWFNVESVLPGALVPALLSEKETSGEQFRAQDFKHLGFMPPD